MTENFYWDISENLCIFAFLKNNAKNMNNIIITINRECGSGGKEIALRLGEKLGFKVYGRELLETIAEKYNISIEEMDRIKAQKSNWWSDFCRFYTQFGAASQIDTLEPRPTPQSLYYAEEQMLRELAAQESCIVVGRAGFHIFRNNPNALHLLITADRNARINRISQKENISLDEATKLVEHIDKERETFTQTIANTSRYDTRNYDFVLNVTDMPLEMVAEFLAKNIRHKFHL